MARTKKFPKIIHITFEQDGSDSYHSVREDGVLGVDENGKEIAVYKLVQRGRVRITRKLEA